MERDLVRLPDHLGSLALDRGDVATARSRFEEGLRLRRQSGDTGWVHSSLADLASLAAATGRPDRALRLAAASTRLSEMTGAALQPTERSQLERWLLASRNALGETSADEAWAAGRTMTLEQAIAVALDESAGDAQGLST